MKFGGFERIVSEGKKNFPQRRKGAKKKGSKEAQKQRHNDAERPSYAFLCALAPWRETVFL
jgi:hypothetical protein